MKMNGQTLIACSLVSAVGFLMLLLVFGVVDAVAGFKNQCEKFGYYNVDKTTRIKCTVEKLEWEKAE